MIAVAAWRRLNLWPRLVIVVTAGFGVLFAVFGILALRAVEESTDRILEERLVIARMAARDIDRILERGFYELDRATTFAAFDPAARSLEDEFHMLSHAYGRVGILSLGVYFLDARGRVVLSQPPGKLSSGTDLSHEPYVAAALRSKRRTVSGPFRDGRTGRPAVGLARPILEPGGRMRSLLVGLVDVSSPDFVGVLRHVRDLGHTGHAELVARGGLVIAATDPGGFLKPGEHLDFYLRKLRTASAGVEDVPYAPWHSLPMNRHGEHHVMAFAPVRLAPWGVAVGGATGETYAPVARLRKKLLFGGVLALVLLWGATLAGARLLVRPVRVLTDAAGEMAAGDLDEPVRVREGGEIGRLAESLESMRTQLRDSLERVRRWGEDLEAKVQARTAEVRTSNRRLAGITAVATAANETRETDAMLHRCLDVALDSTGADAGLIRLLDERSRRLGPALVRGDADAFPCRGRGIGPDECPCSRVAAAEQPLYVAAGARATLSPPCRAHDGRGLAILPLRARGRNVGVLALAANRAQVLAHDEQRTLAAIAGEIAVAVKNARLFDELRRLEAQREAHRLKVELISAVSHELRTPLGFIRSYATTFLSEDIDPIDSATQRKFARIIDEEAAKLQGMIDDLLDASRLQSGHVSLDTEPVRLGLLVEKAAERVRPTLEDTGRTVTIEFRDGELEVLVDPLRVEQVLTNLLENAARYSFGDGAIEVLAFPENGEAVVAVTDQGDGIPAEERDVIFEPFYRGENSRRSAVRGTGLGLSICRAIVEAHGGRLWLESGVNGNTFLFTLPLAGDEPGAGEEA